MFVCVQNYGQGCLDSFNCQQQNVNIDSGSSIALYMLSTVAVEFMVSRNAAEAGDDLLGECRMRKTASTVL